MLKNCKWSYFFLLIFTLMSLTLYSQEPKPSDKIQDKVVIGFPGITPDQLDQVKTEFAKYSQISTARYFDNHQCMLISFSTSEKKFSVYAELLKVIDEHAIYDTKKCYFKIKEAYDIILHNSKAENEYTVK